MSGKTHAVRAPLATLAALVRWMSTRLRRSVVLAALLSASGKLLAVLVALEISSGDVRMASILGLVGLACFSAFRLVASGLRVDAEIDLHRALTRALLESDVLAAQAHRPLRVVFDLGFHARGLVTDTVPELAASVLAAVAVVPILVSTLPPRFLLLGAVVAAVIVVALSVLGRATATLQRRVSQAQERMYEQIEVAIGGRVELAARGAEASALVSLDGATARYRGAARRGAWGNALLGRAPLAAGLVAVVILLVLDSSYRETVTSAVVGRALILGACLPVLFGVVLRTNELVRRSAMVTPVLELLALPARPELGRRGPHAPSTPARIVARDVGFAYAPDGVAVLRAVSFEWSAGTPLVVEGANGAGKSTLLRLLLGLCLPTSGAIEVDGVDLGRIDLLAFRRRHVAYLPQRPYLGEATTTVRTALEMLGTAPEEAALQATLERVGLTRTLAAHHGADPLDTLVSELSVGERQRLALARVLLQNADIYVLDEPDANLDRAGVALVAALVVALARDGKLVTIAAHSGELAALAGARVSLG